ncbi:MAG: tetratricopeptide repeat protein [Microscillaceae bacterium]|jgi:Tfp pilus assembly protein PilF|nr:tetratricopeptide repeat protein [Microscillaceae bacterium]
MNQKKTETEIQDLENQLAELGQTWEKNREMTEIALELGKAYLEQAKYDLAKVNFQKIIEWGEADFVGKAYHQLGNLYFRGGKFKLAEENYEQAISYFTDNQQLTELGSSYNLLGALFTQQKDFQTALPYFEQSIAWNCKHLNYEELGKNFHNLRVLVNEGMATSNQKIYYEKLLQNPDFAPARAFGLHNLGLWYYREQDYTNAQQKFDEARQIKEAEAIGYGLGSDYYHLGSIEEVEGESKIAIDLHKIALQKMLANEEYEYIGVTIYYLQHSLPTIQDAELYDEISQLLQAADNQGINLELQTEEETLAKYAEEEEEIKDLDFSQTLAQVVDFESGKSLEDMYAIMKAGLPETAEKYAEVSFDLLEKLQSNYKNAWFSKKTKKQAFEDKKNEVIKVLADYPDLSNWLTEIQKFE